MFSPQLTSYDYDAPISEAGGTGQPGIGGPNKFQVCQNSCFVHAGSMSGNSPFGSTHVLYLSIRWPACCLPNFA